MSRRSRPFGSLILIVLCLAGCAPIAAVPTSTPPATLPIEPAATTVPAATTAPASLPPTPEVDALAGELIVDPDRILPGTLGSWFLDDVGSDVPWIPARGLTPIPVTATTELAARFADGTPITEWQAVAARAADLVGATTVGMGGRETSEPPLNVIPLGPLPSGDWVVAVRLVRSDGRGEATFFWLVTVA